MLSTWQPVPLHSRDEASTRRADARTDRIAASTITRKLFPRNAMFAPFPVLCEPTNTWDMLERRVIADDLVTAQIADGRWLPAA